MPSAVFVILAILLPVGCIGNLVVGIDELHSGQSNPGNEWYVHFSGATLNGVLSWCLLSAEVKRRRRERDRVTEPLRWKDRIEVRTAIYVFGVVFLLNVPFAVVRAVSRVQSDPLRSATFWGEFEFGSLIFAGIGAMLVRYDRKRLRQDLKTFSKSQCVNCGYDLRASPERCPECGTAVESGNMTPIQS